MTHFKSHSNQGFMLTEVLLALAILGIVMVPLFNLQSGVMRSLSSVGNRIVRIPMMQDFLLQSRDLLRADELEGEKREKKYDDPPSALGYYIKKMEDSEVYKKLPGILQEETECVWQERLSSRKEIMVSFVYKPEKKQEQKKP